MSLAYSGAEFQLRDLGIAGVVVLSATLAACFFVTAQLSLLLAGLLAGPSYPLVSHTRARMGAGLPPISPARGAGGTHWEVPLLLPELLAKRRPSAPCAA
mmetsp:Transcript_23899/g.75282  ORF Transcript_23899/g.75282 Transcript_23899/m.75282 type:complete len:100 (-) Transcript_23899:393-692(-)